MMARRGFTIIEVLAAVAVVALLSGLGAVAVRRAIGACPLPTVADRITDLDRSVRLAATSTDSSWVMTFRGQSIVAREASGGDDAPVISLGLPSGVRITAIRAVGGGETVEIGQHGRSHSYALTLRRGTERVYVFVAGLTGQARLVSPGELQALWDILRQGEAA